MNELAIDGALKNEDVFARYASLLLEERENDYEPFNSMLELKKATVFESIDWINGKKQEGEA